VAEEVVQLICHTGGISALAHPWALKNPVAVIRSLKAAGLHAMEVYRSDGKVSGMVFEMCLLAAWRKGGNDNEQFLLVFFDYLTKVKGGKIKKNQYNIILVNENLQFCGSEYERKEFTFSFLLRSDFFSYNSLHNPIQSYLSSFVPF